MAEEKIVSETVKSVSSGTVKITLEEYNDLLAKAAEKAPVIYRTVQKTAEMVAKENVMWGSALLGGGLGLALIGGGILRTGIKQTKAL